MTKLDNSVLMKVGQIKSICPTFSSLFSTHMTGDIALFSIEEAARYLKVSEKTIRRWELRGVLLPIRTSGGHRRYTINQLYRFKKNKKKLLIDAKKNLNELLLPETQNDAAASILLPNEKDIKRILNDTTGTATEPSTYNTLQEIYKHTPNSSKFSLKAFSLIFVSLFIVYLFVGYLRFLPSFIQKSNDDSGLSGKNPQDDIAKVLAATSFASAQLKVNVPVEFTKDIAVNSGNITSTSDSFNFVNEDVTTLGIGGAAETITLGATTGKTTINNSLVVKGGTNDIAGTLNLSGNKLTSSGDLTIDPGGGGVSVGTETPTNVDLTGDDFFISGDLEVKGVSYIPTLTINGDTVTDITGSGLQVSGGSLSTTLGDTISSSEIEDGTIKAEDLNSSNAPTDAFTLTYNSSTGGFTWTDPAASTTDAGWTDFGTLVTLTTSTDNVTIGSVANVAKLGIVGDTDEIQLLVRGNSTQTSNIFAVQNASSSNLVTIDNLGNLTLASGADLTIGSIGLNDTTGTTTSGASLIGVFDELTNSNSTNLQDVLDDLDAAITGGSTGDITAVGDVLTGDAFTQTAGNDGTTLYFEGATADSNEIALTTADPGSDITVTIPAIAGTLASLAGTQTFTGAKTFGDISSTGNTTIGNANTDTLTINAGSSGIGISFGDASFTTCTALETVGGVLTCGSDAGSSSMTSFILSGDTGSDQTITDGNTLEVAGGTNGIDTVGTATDTITLNLDTTEIGTTTFGSGSGFTWTFDAGATDPTLAFANNAITLSAGTTTLSGVLSVQGTSIGLNNDADANNIFSFNTAAAGTATGDIYWGNDLLCDVSETNCGWATSASSPFTSSGGIITQTTSTDKTNLKIGQAGDYGLLVDTSVVPTVDMVQISNSGQAITTDGVDALAINFLQGGGGGLTNSAINVSLTPSAIDEDVVNGLNISATGTSTGNTNSIVNGLNLEAMTGGDGTENAILIGSGWDFGLYTQSPAFILNTSATQSSLGINTTTTATGVNGIALAFNQIDDADATDTNAGLNIAMTSSSGDADTLYGLNIANITPGTATEYAINIGTGWDANLNFVGAGDINIADNTANAFTVSEGSNNYLQVLTTNGSESLKLGNSQSVMSLVFDIGASGTITFSDFPSCTLKTTLTGALTCGDDNVASNFWQLSSNVLAPGTDATVTDRLVLGGNTSTVHQFEVNGSQPGKALVAFNETGNQNILTASGSGTTVLSLTRQGDLLSGFTQLDASSTTNGTGTSSTTMVLSSVTNFNVGNYIKLDNTGGANCDTGVTTCYDKITAINVGTNTLTLASAVTWATGKTVQEWHLPEVGGTDIAQTVTNRYGRGYFVNGIVSGNGSTYYDNGRIYTSDADSENSASFSITTGATTTSGNSGNITIDTGTAAGTAGTIAIGTTTTSGITIGRTGVTTNIAGSFQTGGTTRLSNTGALSNITDYSQISGGFSAILSTTNAATFGSTTTNSDSLALAPNTTGSNAFTGTITTADLTAARTYTFPDATGTVCLTTGNCAGVGGIMNTFNIAGDSGSDAVTNAQTVTVAGGTNGIDTSESGRTVTLNLDTTEIGSTTFGSGSALTYTFDASAGTDTTIAFGNNTQTLTTGTLTLSGTTTLTASSLATFTTAATLDMTGTSTLNCTDCMDFDDMKDSMTLDASTSIGFGASTFGLTFTDNGSGDETHNLSSTGDFIIQDNGTPFASFLDTGAITFAPTSNQNITMNFAGTGLLDINPITYTNGAGAVDIARGTNFTGVAAEVAIDLQVKPSLTVTEPGSGTFTWRGGNIDMSGISVTAGAGTSAFSALRLAGVSDADTGTSYGLDIANLTGTAATEYAINIGTGWDANLNFVGAGDINIPDNTSNALTISEGTNNYLQILTTDSGESLKLGNSQSAMSLNFDIGASGAITLPDFSVCTLKTNLTGVLLCGEDNVASNFWQLNSNVLAPGTDATVTDRLVLGGNTSTVHQFEVNGKQTGKALVAFNETGDQDIFTASASGTTRFVISNSGNVGIGISNPSWPLSIAKTFSAATTGEQFGINVAADYSVADTGLKQGIRATTFADQLAASGTLVDVNAITAIVNKINTGPVTNASAVYARIDNTNATGAITNGYGVYIADSIETPGTITNDYGLYQVDTGAMNYFGGFVGIGTTTPTSKLHVSGAAIGKALAVFDETGNQNILTASASGTTKFTIDRNGNLGIAGSTVSSSNYITAPNFTVDTSGIIQTASVGTAALRTGTGSTSGASDFDITMNDYGFYPNAELDDCTGSATERFTPIRTNATNDQVGRFAIDFSTNCSAGTVDVRWRYITASDRPTIWLIANGDSSIGTVWQAEDPSNQTEYPANPNPFAGTPLESGQRFVSVKPLSTPRLQTLYDALPETERSAVMNLLREYLVNKRKWLSSLTTISDLDQVSDRYHEAAQFWAMRFVAQYYQIDPAELIHEIMYVENDTLQIKSDAYALLSSHLQYRREAIVENQETKAKGADTAEWYSITHTSEQPQPGNIVSIDTSDQSGFVAKSEIPYDEKVIGIVSTAPYDTLAEKTKSDDIQLALNGRVPVSVSLENGPIKKGDPITASSIHGVGMKSTKEGQIVGKALEGFDPENGIGQQESCLDSNSNSNQKCGKVLVFLNLSWYNPDTILTSLEDLEIRGNNGLYTVLNTKSGSAISKIGSLASLFVGNIKAGMASIQELISPSIKTKELAPIDGEKDIAIKLGNESTGTNDKSGFGKLLIQNSEGKTVASVDEKGNAEFSGDLSAENASISGELTANTIKADHIVSPELMSRDEIEALLANTAHTNQELLKSADNWPTNASGSASFSALALENIYVTGIAAFDTATISRSITIGSDLVISSGAKDGHPPINSIDTLNAPLSLQSSAAQPLLLMAGLVTIDTSGNVQIAGNLAVKGTIESQGLGLQASSETGFGKLLTIRNKAGQEVAGISTSGDAEFKNVKADSIAVSNDPEAHESQTTDGTSYTTNATAGNGKFAANTRQVTIKNTKVQKSSLIFVTPTSETQSPLFIKTKEDGMFVVGSNIPFDHEVTFNWWIVELTDSQSQLNLQ